jgi:hypothetical protein
MRITSDAHEKLESAYQLLQGGTISVSTFEHVCTILKGLHPKLDEKLDICSKALDNLQKIESGDIIALSAEGLPEDTEERKKRKKALLFFINSFKNLKSEVERIDAEFAHEGASGNPSVQSQLTASGRILGFAKGPFGIATLIALGIVGFLILTRHPSKNTSIVSPKVQVIMYNGKQIPVSQLYVGRGSDCDSPHYHATTGSVTATDGTVIPDPENCGYGKLKDMQVTEVEVTPSPNP